MSEDWDADAWDPASTVYTPYLYSQYAGRFDDKLLPDGEKLSYEKYRESGGKYSDFNAGRMVILYEFAFDGEFRARIELPLIKLNEAGRDRIRSRVPGRPLIGPKYIHFHERFRVTGNSRVVRVDYLFTRDGGRVAVWSNENFFDVYSIPTELRVPYPTILKPQWMLNNQLVAIQPEGYQLSRHDLMNDLSYLGHTSSSDDWEDQYLHVVAATSIDGMIHNAQNPALVGNGYGFYHAQLRHGGHTLYVVEFPVPSRFVAHKTYRLGWWADASDEQHIWFLDNITLWRIDVHPSVGLPEFLNLPSPVGEIWASVKQLTDSWVRTLETLFVEDTGSYRDEWFAFAENGTSYVEIGTGEFFAWGDRVLIEWVVRYEYEIVYSTLIDYRIVDGEMVSRGRVQPARKAVRSVCRSMHNDTDFVAPRGVAGEVQRGTQSNDACIDLVHRELAGSHLISLGYQAGSKMTPARWILLTDIESGREDWFVPRVPANTVQPIASSEIGRERNH